MITVRRSGDRGRTDAGWLQSRHSFSFGHYFDPHHVRFGPLRVINEDIVAPGAGFDTHGHQDMEILTYVLEGALEHKDSLGSGSVIRPGDIQRMTAGTGIRHSEFNHSRDEAVHFLQIWIVPERTGLKPGYEQKRIAGDGRRDGLRLCASRDGRDGSVTIHQDTDLYTVRPGGNGELAHALAPGRLAWVQAANGVLEVNGIRLEAGDGAAIADETGLRLAGAGDVQALLFDMTAAGGG